MSPCSTLRSFALPTALIAASLACAVGTASADDVGPVAAPGPRRPILRSGPPAVPQFYVEPRATSEAGLAADAIRATDPVRAAALDVIASHPQGVWVGDQYTASQVSTVVDQLLLAAQGSSVTLVLYAIPGRDCGLYSSGGLAGPAAYHEWVQAIADAIHGRPVRAVVEPDALAQLTDCLSPAKQVERLAMLRDAMSALTAAGAAAYLDAGHDGWQSVPTTAARLLAAGVSLGRGFALNVSNYKTTAAETTYGNAISALTGGAHFVIDTSRNGNGPGDTWCNPTGRALGAFATTTTGNAQTDAFLWIKRPGRSDGTCGGGPKAGTFWVDYAVGLALNSNGGPA